MTATKAAKKKATLIGVPLDWGASKRGAAGGPAAIRRANIIASLEDLGLSIEDSGDIAIPVMPAKGAEKGQAASVILKACKALADRTAEIVEDGRIPITLGGDHSLAMGSVAGVARAFHAEKRKIGLLWVDAHADMNTPETSPSGNIHGMPFAHILGLGDKSFKGLAGHAPMLMPRNACLVGVRDVDKFEAVNIRKSGANVFTMQSVDRFGMGVVTEQAIDIACDDTAGFHLSFDIDAVDPTGAPGTGVPKRGGLTYREAHLLMELAADSERLIALDLVEVNPLEDTHNATAELAVELIASAMGKNIY
jgi:arginase